MTRKEAKMLAEPIVREVVNCMAERAYARIPEYADFKDGITAEEFQEWAEGYLEDNDLSYYDRYDVPCNFKPQYDPSLYHQFEVYIYDNGAGFAVEYDLTTNNERNDLTLMMEFMFDNQKEIQAYIEGIHVL